MLKFWTVCWCFCTFFFFFFLNTWLSWKFCYILVSLQLWILLLRSWRLQTTLDCMIWNSYLTKFVSMTWSTVLESMFLSLLDYAWSLRFLQLKRNFLNHLVTVLWSTAPSTFAQQIFLVASAVLYIFTHPPLGQDMTQGQF